MNEYKRDLLLKIVGSLAAFVIITTVNTVVVVIVLMVMRVI